MTNVLFKNHRQNGLEKATVCFTPLEQMTLDARVVDEMPGNTTRVSNTKLLGRATVLQSCELAIQSYLTISIVIGII